MLAEVAVFGFIALRAELAKRRADQARKEAASATVKAESAKGTANDAKRQSEQTDENVNTIDLDKGDRGRSIEKFLDIEFRLKQVEDALAATLLTTVRKADRQRAHERSS